MQRPAREVAVDAKFREEPPPTDEPEATSLCDDDEHVEWQRGEAEAAAYQGLLLVDHNAGEADVSITWSPATMNDVAMLYRSPYSRGAYLDADMAAPKSLFFGRDRDLPSPARVETSPVRTAFRHEPAEFLRMRESVLRDIAIAEASPPRAAHHATIATSPAPAAAPPPPATPPPSSPVEEEGSVESTPRGAAAIVPVAALSALQLLAGPCEGARAHAAGAAGAGVASRGPVASRPGQRARALELGAPGPRRPASVLDNHAAGNAHAYEALPARERQGSGAGGPAPDRTASAPEPALEQACGRRAGAATLEALAGLAAVGGGAGGGAGGGVGGGASARAGLVGQEARDAMLMLVQPLAALNRAARAAPRGGTAPRPLSGREAAAGSGRMAPRGEPSARRGSASSAEGAARAGGAGRRRALTELASRRPWGAGGALAPVGASPPARDGGCGGGAGRAAGDRGPADGAWGIAGRRAGRGASERKQALSPPPPPPRPSY